MRTLLLALLSLATFGCGSSVPSSTPEDIQKEITEREKEKGGATQSASTPKVDAKVDLHQEGMVSADDAFDKIGIPPYPGAMVAKNVTGMTSTVGKLTVRSVIAKSNDDVAKVKDFYLKELDGAKQGMGMGTTIQIEGKSKDGLPAKIQIMSYGNGLTSVVAVVESSN